jgi:formylglycine-generating enzyme required for sulfatase activity
MPRPLRVFLCHASQDKPTVWKLHRYLKQHGVKPWLDQEDLLPGEDWEVEIPKALYASDVILVCLSKNSVNKEGFVQKEITFALDKAMEKPEGTIFIIPVKLEDCEIPRRLTRYQWVDLSRADGRKRLLMGLNKRVSDLGSEVQQITLDDTRRTPVPKSPKPKIKKSDEQEVPVPFSPREKGRDEGKPLEEPKQEIPVVRQEEKESEVKFTQQKPFKKLLDPASLSPNENFSVVRVSNPTKPVAPKNRQAKSLTYGFWSVGLLVLLLGGFGLNYLFKNTPVATVTVSPTNTVIPKLPTSMKVLFTPTSTPTKTPIPTPTLGIGSTMTGEKGETLVYVPAGEFAMGDGAGDAPVHTVYLDAFWIDQTEVTNAMYAKCVDAGKCDPPSSTDYFSNSSYANHPVVYVDWNQANTYCSWADRRLPTEAEWEKAARGADERTYPWGEGIDCTKANYNYSCVGETLPVKSYPNSISPYGAYDMAGNVWEWVSSLYEPYPYDANDGREDMNSLDERVLRGGSWSDHDYNVRSSNRVRNGRYSFYISGFRCSRSP